MDGDDLLALRRAVIQLSVVSTKLDWHQPYNAHQESVQGSGTAFVVDELPSVDDGFFAMTAYHVVQNAVRIRATLFDDEAMTRPSAPIEATLAVYSIALDAAIIHVRAPRPRWLKPLAVGDSDGLMPNTQVKVAGFPLRSDFQVTTGFVSGRLEHRVQIDASVNPGNSGGPLVRVPDGAVVGIVVSGMSPENAQNINFCTPYEDVRCLMLDTPTIDPSRCRSVPSGSFNFTLVPTTEGLCATRTHGRCTGGALATRVDASSSAYEKGLREGDIVCSIDSVDVGYRATVRVPWWKVDALKYTTLLSRTPVGSHVAISFYSAREGAMREVRVPVQRNLSRFRTIDADSESVPFARLGGVVVQPLTVNLLDESEALKKRFGYVLGRAQLRQDSLLIVTHIDADSPFTTMSQLHQYDTITSVGDVQLPGGDLAAYERAFDRARKAGMVTLGLYTDAVVSASAAEVDAWHAAHGDARATRPKKRAK